MQGKVMGQDVDAEHLSRLIHRPVEGRPAVFIGDTRARQTAIITAHLKANEPDRRTTQLELDLENGAYPWQDQIQRIHRMEVYQLIRSDRLVREALAVAFGDYAAKVMDRKNLPRDAVWLVVLRPGRLRIAAVYWPVNSSQAGGVYFGRTFRLPPFGAPPAREVLGRAA
jgi:hypothetical protein